MEKSIAKLLNTSIWVAINIIGIIIKEGRKKDKDKHT